MSQKTKLTATQKKLIQAAKLARKKAYAPYSKFKVGSALLTSDGKIYQGCNIEVTNYRGTICAEHAALVHAITEGKNKFSAIAVLADQKIPCPPCGACRQALFEFAPKLEVIMVNLKDDVLITTLDRLLPGAFHLSNRSDEKK